MLLILINIVLMCICSKI